MKIVLIRSNMSNYRAGDAMPPLAMGILAARAKDHQITFYDDRIEEIPDHLEADLIALSVETFTARRSYQLADYYRAQGHTIVMGGYHPSFMQTEALEHADSIIVGDAEGAWEDLLNDFEGNTLKKIYHSDHHLPLNNYEIDRSIFKNKRYAPIELLQYTRGCRFVCDFCSIHKFYDSVVRARPIEDVKKEILAFKTNRFIVFVDDNLFGNRQILDDLLTMITPLKKRWGCQISIDIARDHHLLDQLVAAGCCYVLIGFESLNADNLKQMHKPWNKVSGSYDEVVHALHSRGISIYGTFVFGYDEDTIDTIQESLDFALRNKLEIVNFNPLIPTPGSTLYQRLKEEGRLISPNWWIDPNYHYGDPIFEPKKIKAQDLALHCFEAKKKFYSYSSITKRLLNFKKQTKWSDRAITLLANIISHREIIKKQGQQLGGKP